MLRVLAVLVVVFLVSGAAAAADGYKKEMAAFEKFLPPHMKVDRIPGMTIGFFKGDVQWGKAFGMADLENGLPATLKSAYRLASVSKSMTAVAVLQLVEKGKIKLDDPVQKYVRFFPQKKWTVTVRQLLGHLGGVSHYQDFKSELHIKEHRDTREAVDIFADFDLVAEPGTKYQYTSYGYNLLGAVVEGAAKQPFGPYLKENVWKPLGMKDSYMDDPHALIPNRVRGYRLVEGKLQNSEFIDISSRFAAGGTRSTVPDLLKYARGLDEGTLLSKKSMREMFTSMQTQSGRLTTYGMGWHVRPINGRFCAYHTGGQAETRTLLVMFPDEDFTLALAYNFEGGRLWDYGRRLAQLVFGDPWSMDVMTGSKEGDLLYEGLHDVYNHGLAWYIHWGQRRDDQSDPKDIEAAFQYLNKCLDPEVIQKDYRKGRGAVANGVHPKAGEAFTKVGAFMAARLAEKNGLESLKVYHRTGPLRFFFDYMELYQSSEAILRTSRFNEGLERQVEEWSPLWDKVNTPWVRRLWIDESTNFKAVGSKLESLFGRSPVRANFLQALFAANRYLYCNGFEKKALESVSVASRLYPKSVVPLVMKANTMLAFGKKGEAADLYARAEKIDAKASVLSPFSFFVSAAHMELAGNLEGAEAMLRKGLEKYPANARLHDSLAEIYLWRAKQHLRKALEADPTYEPAHKRLKRFE
jgi:CubicO group peptidase (beta-lactamase class C family)